MDALKLIAQDSVKKEAPVVEVGDTVRVQVELKRETRKDFRLLKEPLLLRSTAEFLRLSQFVAYPTALA